MNCPVLNERCLGPACGNWNDPDSKFGKPSLPRGCRGDDPTYKWARWYIERFCKKGEVK